MQERDLSSDYRAICFLHLGNAYETLKDEKAPLSYFLASANYFILFNQGVPCLDHVVYCLDKVIELADDQFKEDATLMKKTIEKLSNPQKEIKIPEISHSPRGKAIIETFKGKKFHFEPKK